MNPILSRRSIRQYTDQPVDDAAVRQLLEAAMAAPSAHNQQPWAFVVVRRRDLLDAIPGFHPYAAMCRQAQGAIVVCADPSREEKSKDFWPLDCSAATENILVMAASLGLGSLWVSLYPREDRMQGMARLLGLPQGMVPFALVPFGWPAESKPPAARFDEGRVHLDRW